MGYGILDFDPWPYVLLEFAFALIVTSPIWARRRSSGWSQPHGGGPKRPQDRGVLLRLGGGTPEMLSDNLWVKGGHI